MKISLFGGKVMLSFPRAVLCIFWLFCLGIFIAPLFRNINIGSLAGGAVFLLLTAVTVFPAEFLGMISKAWSHTAGKIILTIICITAFELTVTAAVMSVFMIKSMNRPPPQSDIPVIVLGCRVDGDVPSPVLEKRIKAAYEYLNKHPEALCIASGGQGSDEDISEAVCIRNSLISLGISGERIFCEDKSTSTRENMRFSAEILESIDLPKKAVLITSEYHGFRAGIIAEKQGFEVYSVSSHTAWYLLPVCWVREWFGIAYEYVF